MEIQKKKNNREKMLFKNAQNRTTRSLKKASLKDQEYVLLRKGKYEPVLFKLESRGGNKKVTNLSNIATFEIDQNQLQARLRIACSVSVTINNSSCESNNYSVDIPGNQIQPISEILESKLHFILLSNVIY